MIRRTSLAILESLCRRRDPCLLRCLPRFDISASEGFLNDGIMTYQGFLAIRRLSTGDVSGGSSDGAGTTHHHQGGKREEQETSLKEAQVPGHRRERQERRGQETKESIDVDERLDAWGSAMEKGDWKGAWEAFESILAVSQKDFPSLEQILAVDTEQEKRTYRRQREEELKLSASKLHVRRVDDQGRAHAVGRRKTSTATVWIRPGLGHMMINRKPYDLYFPELERRLDLITPFVMTDNLGRFDVMASVQGGGSTGQAQAVRHAISRALQNWDTELRGPLKSAGLLTRDPRMVERKKTGKRKARRAFQWVKR